MTVSSSPPGIPSPVRLAGWLNDTVGGEPSELVYIQLIAGGRSNLTYRLTVAGAGQPRLLVLRRPPLGHVLPTAHDMGREYRVLSALSGTQVPVARPVAFCDDTEVIGAPFYLMEHVPGAVLRTRADTAVLTEVQARELSEASTRTVSPSPPWSPGPTKCSTRTCEPGRTRRPARTGRVPGARFRRARRPASACRAHLRSGAPLAPDLYIKGRATCGPGSRPSLYTFARPQPGRR